MLQVLREGDWQEDVTSGLVKLGCRLLDVRVLPLDAPAVGIGSNIADAGMGATAGAPGLAPLLQHVVQPPSLQVGRRRVCCMWGGWAVRDGSAAWSKCVKHRNDAPCGR